MFFIWGFIFFSLLSYAGMFFSNNKYLTKDVKLVRDLYQEFITNYNKLNKLFDLSNPIEIYTMFHYLLYKGYLSVDKNFMFSGKVAKDIEGLFGVDVIAGKGVCRHISSMLVDILNNYGIESGLLSVYFRSYRLCTYYFK